MVDSYSNTQLQECDIIYESRFPYADQANEILESLTVNAQQFSSWNDTIAEAQGLLMQQGAVIIENTKLDNLAHLHDLCTSFGTLMDYTGGTNHRTNQGKNVLNVGIEPPFANVSAHNEMSYSNRYPEIFIIGCKSAPKHGAGTVICDNNAITDTLINTKFGKSLRSLGIRYIRNFHDAENKNAIETSMVSWQQVFGSNNRDEAIEIASNILGGNQACNIDITSNNGLRITYHAAAYEHDPDTNKDLCFVSIGNHGYWFRKWPPYNHVPHIERPWHMQYGDGTELSEDDLALFAKISNENGYMIEWNPGKIAILRNRRFAHARPPYQLAEGETRELGVLLMNPTTRFGQTI